MYISSIGPMDGDKWESLIQAVFKRKYDTYQEMLASPGDFGIEGFVLAEGIAIQCYCPDKQYDTATLYDKQRAKITTDLNKLELYEKAIIARIGCSKIKKWIFITPEISKNDLLAHARTKEIEMRNKNLTLLDNTFTVLIHDIGFYILDIRNIQLAQDIKIQFATNNTSQLGDPKNTTEYDKNIYDKNKIRSIKKMEYNKDTHLKLNEITKRNYFDGYSILRSIYNQTPELHEKILRIINTFEDYVEENSATWEDSPRELITHIQDKLTEKLRQDPSISAIDSNDLTNIVNHMTARWIAECPMRITE